MRRVCASAKIVKRVHVAYGDRILIRDGQYLVTPVLEITSRILRQDPIWGTDIFGAHAAHGLDHLCAAVHIAYHPWLAFFPLCRAQIEMAVGVVFDLVTVFKQL